jgi:dUTP pyrophosphatase
MFVNLRMSCQLLFKKLSANAKAPIKSTAVSAGFDIFSAEDCTLYYDDRRLIRTDIKICLPKGCYGRIAPRSGLAVKAIDVSAGVIDPDYRGNIHVLLVNNGRIDFPIRKGQKIAQLILEKYVQEVEVIETADDDKLGSTERNEDGFGSTGDGLSMPVYDYADKAIDLSVEKV